MILQALKDYGDREKPSAEDGVVPDAFENDVGNIRWRLVIDEQGKFVDLRSCAVERTGAKGKKFTAFPELSFVPKNVTSDRSHGGNPQFLADKLEYWFGIPEKTNAERSLKAHIALANAFAAEFPDDSRAQAVKKFFDRVERKEVSARWESKPDRGKGKLVISVDGIDRDFLVKTPADRIALYLDQDDLRPVFHASINLRAFWSRQYREANAKRLKDSAHGKNAPCLVCGNAKPATETFGLFKGLADQGTSLVFTGKPAYQSYHFEDCPVCLDCSQAIIRGLELLLKNRSTFKRLQVKRPSPGAEEATPPVVFVFWTRQPTEFDFGKAVEADVETVKLMLETVQRGLPRQIAEQQFYILGLSESYRRTMVRYWTETNVKSVVEHLASWFEELCDGFKEFAPLPLMRLCQMTVRQPSPVGDDWKIPARVSSSLFLSAFLGKPVPPPVLQMLVNRVRIIPQADFEKENPTADYKFRPERMALLRLTLNRLMKNNEPQFKPGLDVGRPEPEYHCGRLLAVCDAAMRWSNSSEPGKPGKSTVADRFMGSASSAPCSVLPVVYRNSRHHMNKLKRDLPAKFLQMERLLDEILSKLKSYPVTLTPQEAGVFILGFHHQRQYFFLVSRYSKLKRQQKDGELPDENKTELDALEDFVNRARFDNSLLADLPDEEAPEAPIAESE